MINKNSKRFKIIWIVLVFLIAVSMIVSLAGPALFQ